MWLLALEAAVAFGMFIFIVWWTMFSGRKPDLPPQQSSIEKKSSTSDQTPTTETTPDN
ncbi:MAG: hypothetical protein K2X63_04575 [Burkholderiaceae bacterium]|nr:hypothetical protein [Burkholderiaceae bacterium]